MNEIEKWLKLKGIDWASTGSPSDNYAWYNDDPEGKGKIVAEALYCPWDKGVHLDVRIGTKAFTSSGDTVQNAVKNLKELTEEELKLHQKCDRCDEFRTLTNINQKTGKQTKTCSQHRIMDSLLPSIRKTFAKEIYG